jgi:hypothetical protein
MSAAEAAIESAYAPDTDHTLLTEDGKFIAIYNASTTTYMNLYYMSPLLNGTKCFGFWYYIYGPQVKKYKN